MRVVKPRGRKPERKIMHLSCISLEQAVYNNKRKRWVRVFMKQLAKNAEAPWFI